MFSWSTVSVRTRLHRLHPKRRCATHSPNPARSTVRPLTFALLISTHPNHQFVDTLLMQLTGGFEIGYHGPHRYLRSPNLPSTLAHLEVVDNQLWHEGPTAVLWAHFLSPLPAILLLCNGRSSRNRTAQGR